MKNRGMALPTSTSAGVWTPRYSRVRGIRKHRAMVTSRNQPFLASALKNSYTLLGALAGMLVVYAVDKKLDFATAAPFRVQVLKVLLGLVVVLAVKEGLKAPLELVFRGHMAARAVRYCAIVLTAGILWPMAFPWLHKLGRKETT